MALIGDAGYCGSPLSGHGTSTSLVGAYVLAGELAATPDDHEAAFARYQQEMRDYVAECQKLPPGGVRGFAPQSQVVISLRTLSMRLMTARPMRTLIAKQFQKPDRITLEDYQDSAGPPPTPTRVTQTADRPPLPRRHTNQDTTATAGDRPPS
jgi:flavin-dependent dehydrogenase